MVSAFYQLMIWESTCGIYRTMFSPTI